MRRNPTLFNPLWSLVYPLFGRDGKYVGAEYTNRKDAFRTIYEENRWGSAESRSGRGSTLAYTRPLRKSLERCLRKLDVEIFLDVPCGDFNWMRHVQLPSRTRYIGGDIVRPLIEQLQVNHGGEKYCFRIIDIMEGKLPPADLWLCRDVLFHLPNEDIEIVLKNFAASNIQYLLTTTYDFPKRNENVNAGGFRFINLLRPPFELPEPLSRIADFVAPEPPRYLALWSRSQVEMALRHRSKIHLND